MSSVYQNKQTDSEKKSQEQELLDDARYHTELETAKDDAQRASDVHEERTGKPLDISDKNVMEGEFPEKK